MGAAFYLTEVAGGFGDAWIENELRQENADFNAGLPRLALKMATGSGKTVVMAMLIAWQALNKLEDRQDRRFSDAFLFVTPGITIRDRLTGAGNLFMVFGEPDVDIAPVDVYGNLQVTLRGVDVYDPTTGAIRSNSTDDIACWFIDSNYDGESFFVRHAYFTGADEP